MHLMHFSRGRAEPSQHTSQSLESSGSQSHLRFTDLISSQRHGEILGLMRALERKVDQLQQAQDEVIERMDSLLSAAVARGIRGSSTLPVDVEVPSPTSSLEEPVISVDDYLQGRARPSRKRRQEQLRIANDGDATAFDDLFDDHNTNVTREFRPREGGDSGGGGGGGGGCGSSTEGWTTHEVTTHTRRCVWGGGSKSKSSKNTISGPNKYASSSSSGVSNMTEPIFASDY